MGLALGGCASGGPTLADSTLVRQAEGIRDMATAQGGVRASSVVDAAALARRAWGRWVTGEETDALGNPTRGRATVPAW